VKRVASGLLPLISIDRNAPAALYRQIYDAYRSAILGRTLRPGQRVPSTRTLAKELGVSRIPILNAYAQLLAEGYFQSRVGSGTVVSRSLPEEAPIASARTARPAKASPSARPLSKRSLNSESNVPWLRGWGPFGVSQVAFEHFPFGTWNRIITRQSRRSFDKSLDYGDPMGLKKLRGAIANYVRTARGVTCEDDQIMVVSGSQQALEITTRVLMNPGNSVWMEEPGYRFAHRVFRFHDCRVVPVPVDYEGLNVSEGIRRGRRARAALVTPSHQYPLGVTMSASRRLQLLEWAERYGAWVIEDDYDSEYRYETMPIPSLQGLDTNSRVIYIGTFSKVMFPSLRLGYIIVPKDLIHSFLSVRLSMDIGPPYFFQAVMADFITEGHFSRHIRRMRVLYGERREALIESLRKAFGFGVDIVGGQAGMHLSMTLKNVRDRQVALQAAKENLWLVPLSTSYLQRPLRQGFILGFGSTRTLEMPAAVQKLKSLIAKSC
jgi:GntR family transcriptional regulator / MocR family aminotransferase